MASFRGKLGTGTRFKNCVKHMKRQGKSDISAKKICASIGRKKYGAKRFAQLGRAGRRR